VDDESEILNDLLHAEVTKGMAIHIPVSILTPVSSISTYGKILGSSSKGGAHKNDGSRELILDFSEEGAEKDTKSDLHTKDSTPLRAANFSSFKVRNPKQQSVCFLNKGKQCDRTSAKQGVEVTPPPSHYNPRVHLTKRSAPVYSVPRPKTGVSRKAHVETRPYEEDSEEEQQEGQEGEEGGSARARRRRARHEEGWASRLQSALGSRRPQSALAATPPRTDRLANHLSPWMKNSQSGETSAFRNVPRKPLHDMDKDLKAATELKDTPSQQVVRPRSAFMVNLGRSITRAQREKCAPEGAPFGAYTLQLSYNRSLDNDIPVRVGVKKVDGEKTPAVSSIKMEHQVDRPPLNDGQNFNSTPGLEQLGLSQAVWGTEDGWAGGTEQVLTTKRSHFAKIPPKHKNKGKGTPEDAQLDVMYDADINVVKQRSQSVVALRHQRDRETIGAESTEGADEAYNWTRYLDKKQVFSPNMRKQPSRAQRMKAGFGSHSDPPVSVMYDHNKIQKVVDTRVKGVNIDRLTSRDPPQNIPREPYKDQIPCAKAILGIGELPQSPVFGSPPRVPDMGGKSKRFPHHKSKKDPKGFTL